MSTELWGIVLALITVSVTLGTIIYNAGRQAAKIEGLEKWRDEAATDIKVMRALLENISGAISARKLGSQ